MPAPNDQPLWDDDDAPKPAPRARRVPRPTPPPSAGFRHKDFDVIAEVVGGEGGKRLWIFGGIGIGIGVVAVVGFLMWATSGGEPPVADGPPPPVNGGTPDPVKPPDADPPGPPLVVGGAGAKEPPIPVVKPPADTVAVGKRTLVGPGRAVAVGDGVRKLAYAPKFDLLFALSPAGLAVYDAKAGGLLGSYPAVHGFTDLALAPDQSVLYAADSPPAAGFRQSVIHRLDLAGRGHRKLPGPGLALDVEVIDADRFVLRAEWGRGVTLNRWPAEDGKGIVQIGGGGNAPSGPIAYSPTRQRVFLHPGPNLMLGVNSLSLMPYGFAPQKWSGLAGDPADFGTEAVVSTDGELLFLGKKAVRAETDYTFGLQHAEFVSAAARDVVVGVSGRCYHATEGNPVGEFGFVPGAACAGHDGRSVWGYEPATKRAVELTLTERPASVPLPPKVLATRPGAMPRPVDPAPPGTLLGVTEAFAKPVDEPVEELAVSGKHGLVFLRTKRALRVYAAGDDKLFTAATAGGELTALSVSPDEAAVFAADFGGADNGGENPRPGQVFHRFNCADRTASGRGAHRFAYKVAAVSADTFAALGAGTDHDWLVQKWDADRGLSVVGGEVGKVRGARETAYDPFDDRVLLAGGNHARETLREFRAKDGKLVLVGERTAEFGRDAVALRDTPRLILGTDGGHVAVGSAVFVNDPNRPTAQRRFPTPVVALARDVAVTADGTVYALTTSQECGKLGYEPAAAAVTRDGRTLWAYDAAKKRLVRHDIGPKQEVVAKPWALPTVAAPVRPGDNLTKWKVSRGLPLSPRNAVPLAYSAKHELVIVAAGGDVQILDARTGKWVDGIRGANGFVSSLAPDESCFLLADGERLHRYDLAARIWKSSPAGGRGVGLAALDADYYLSWTGGDGGSGVTLRRWDGKDKGLPFVNEPNRIDHGAYDPISRTLWLGTTDLTKRQQHLIRFRVTEKALTPLGDAAGPQWGERGPIRLSPDGKTVYWATRTYDAADPEKSARPGGRAPHAATWDVLADQTGNLWVPPPNKGYAGVLPGLPFAGVLAGRDGRTLWVGGQDKLILYLFEPAGGGGVVVAPPVNPPVMPPVLPPVNPPVAVVPKGKIEDFKPTLFPRPAAPAVPPTKFTEVAKSDDTSSPTTALLIDRHGVLATLAGANGLRLLDTSTGKPLGGPDPPTGVRFAGLTVAPDQSALFALTLDALHRYDFAAKKWESRPHRGTRAVPLDGSTVLLSPPTGKAEPWQLLRWTAAGTDLLGTADLPPLVASAYDPSTGHLYAVARPLGRNSQLKKYTVGGKPFAAEWTADLTVPSPQMPPPVITADGKRVFAGAQAFDAATGKPVGDPLPETVRLATHGFLMGNSGKVYHPETGKELAALPHSTAVGSVASDGKSAVFHDRTGSKLWRYDITAGAVAPPPMPKEPKNPPVVVPFPGKKAARPELPYAAGTQTVAKEVSRLPAGATIPLRLVAAEPAGVVATWSVQFGGQLRLHDLATGKSVVVENPTASPSADLFAPPDQSAVFLSDRKKVYRLKADKKGWDTGELPADTRHVAAVGKDRLLVVSGTPTATVLHELAWADGKWAEARQTKLAVGLDPLAVSADGTFVYAFGRTAAAAGAFRLHEFELTADGPVARRVAESRNPKGSPFVVRLSWDGTRAYHPDVSFDLTAAKLVEEKPAARVFAASRDLLFTADGELLTAGGKPAGTLGHPVRMPTVTADGKALWVYDPDKKDLIKYALTDGK